MNFFGISLALAITAKSVTRLVRRLTNLSVIGYFIPILIYALRSVIGTAVINNHVQISRYSQASLVDSSANLIGFFKEESQNFFSSRLGDHMTIELSFNVPEHRFRGLHRMSLPAELYLTKNPCWMGTHLGFN